ncbi:MAG: HAMP domain-containing protein, partial [Polyangiaceae bacterium]|nr:HAMP domain-containing protein [Polyangiaceae bacterium]
MPLAARLLVALAVAAAAVTALVGLSVQSVARRELERALEDRIEVASRGAHDALERELAGLPARLAVLCGPGSPLADFAAQLPKGGRLDKLPAGALEALRTRTGSLRWELGFEELVVALGDGTVLAADDPTRVGAREPRLAERARGEGGSVRLREGGTAVEHHCSVLRGDVRVAALAAQSLEPIVARLAAEHGVPLALGGGERGGGGLTRSTPVAEVPGLVLVASLSLAPLDRAAAQLDRTILLTGGMALLLAVALAMLVARSVSRPIAQLARQTHKAVRDARPVAVPGGGREVRELAVAFNKAVAQLGSVRRKLARTERIAAQREIARQIAHEIKNPLAPIRTAIETLRRLRRRGDARFDEYFEEATELVLGEVRRIAGIVKQFTEFARLPAPVLARVDLGAAARRVAALHDATKAPVTTVPGDRAMVRRPKPRVELDAEPLPEVLADRDQMVQVLTNLVQNGIEAAAAVRPDPHVCIALRRDGEQAVAVWVVDNGPGVASDVRPLLFAPHPSGKPGGTGLGLAIVQRIVHEHGGEVELVARDALATTAPAPVRELGGAIFRIVLPLDGPPGVESAPAEPA